MTQTVQKLPVIRIAENVEATKTDCDIVALKHRLERQALMNTDHNIKLGRDRLAIDRGQLIINDDVALDFTVNGYQHFAQLIDFPETKKLRNYTDDTLNSMLKDQVRANYGKEQMIRTWNNEKIRAVCSSGYKTIDNHQLVTSLLQALERYGEQFVIKQLHINDDKFYLKVLKPSTIKGEHNIGFILSNSETKNGAVNMESFLYRLICTNGMIGHTGDKDSFRIRHFGKSNVYIPIAENIVPMLDNAKTMLYQLEDLQAKKLKNPIKAIENLGTALKFDQDQVKRVKDAYEIENDGTAFFLPQAITRAAQSFRLEKRIEMEKAGSKAIQLADQYSFLD